MILWYCVKDTNEIKGLGEMKIKANLCTCVDIKEKHMKYFYRLIEGEYNEHQSYGIEVERQDFINNEIINIEREIIKIISYDEIKASKLLQMLCDNQVSPIHLYDIFSSYEDEYIKEFKK